MKKLLLMFALVSMLVFGLATSALASTAYLDYFSGDVDDVDVDGYVLGIGAPIDKFFLGAEYGSFVDDDNFEIDTWKLGLGYLVINEDALKLSLGLGYTSVEDEATSEMDGFGLAVDLVYSVDKFQFDGNLLYVPSGDADGLDVDMIQASLRFTYLFNECFGLGLGYRTYDFSFADDPANDYDMSGFTLGVTYKF